MDQQTLRHGEVGVALSYLHADDPVEEEGFRLVHVADDLIYLVSQRPDDSIANHRHSASIGGCERCRDELITVCRQEGLTPRSASASDDLVVVQALVAAGIGVTTLPELALQAHCHFNLLVFTAGTSPASTLHSFSPLRPFQAAPHTAGGPNAADRNSIRDQGRGVLNLKTP
jgi:DNA-binding transcriptional LysR family regulator